MIYIGDTHGGNYSLFKDWLEDPELHNKNFIHVGDFGLGFSSVPFDKGILHDIDNLLRECNSFLWVVRGNHDDPDWFDGKIEIELSNIVLVKDFDILEIEKERILFVGGAVSIDRIPRQRRRNGWWPGEVFPEITEQVKEKIKSQERIDRVVTHTAPSFCFPTEFNELVYHFCDIDPGLYRDLPYERERVDELFDLVKPFKPKFWCYGHFHNSFVENHEDIEFHLLDIKELKEI